MTQYKKKPDLLDQIIDLQKRIQKLETTSLTITILGSTVNSATLGIDSSGNLIFTDKNGVATTVVATT